MPQSQSTDSLLNLFLGLDPLDKKRFGYYLKSSFFFSKNVKYREKIIKKMARIFDYIFRQSFNKKPFDKIELATYLDVHPSTVYRYLKPFQQELEDFILHNQFQANKSEKALFRLQQAMARNKLDNYYQRELEVCEKLLEEEIEIEKNNDKAAYSFGLARAYEFAALKLSHNIYMMDPKLDTKRIFLDKTEKFAKNFLTEKLMTWCGILVKQHSYRSSESEQNAYQLIALNEAEINWLEQTLEPIPALYFLFYKLLLLDDDEFDEKLFQAIRTQFLLKVEEFPAAHRIKYYDLLLYCHQKRFRKTKYTNDIKEAISDIKQAIEKHYVWRGTSLRISYLRVICSWYIGLANKREVNKEWILNEAKEFIQSINALVLALPDGFDKEYEKKVILSRLDFERKAYKDVMDGLDPHHSKPPHIIQSFYRRCIEIKCYYERNDQQIGSTLDAFAKQVKRNKTLTDERKSEFRLFVKFTQSLVKLRSAPRVEATYWKMEKLKKELSKRAAEKPWLLNKFKELQELMG